MGQDSLNLSLQTAVVFDPAPAFLSLLLAQGLGRSFAFQEPSPAIIDTVQLGRLHFARAMGFATGAPGGGDASRQQRKGDLEENNFVFLCLHPNIYIH